MLNPALFVGSLDWAALPQTFVNGIMFGAIYALVALGYTMVYGVLRLINFAHGEIFMLGTYVALFISWQFGYFNGGPGIGKPPFLALILMLLGAMLVCGMIGLVIERFAYKPLRKSPRITSLITAIGISLFLQYFAALVLPVSPPPSINEGVNPFRDAIQVNLRGQDAGLASQVKELEIKRDTAKVALAQALKDAGVNSEFALPESQRPVRDAAIESEQQLQRVQNDLKKSAMTLNIPKGQAIMLLITTLLMIGLTILVMKTPTGRQMRAVAHDFDSAALMGINVDKIVTLTFFIGSSLAGAGAMMCATFLGPTLNQNIGVVWGVKAFVAAVLGGIGNIPGAVLGGILIGLSENIIVWAGYSQYKDAISFVILIVVLLFKPGGLLGSAKAEKV